MKHTTSCCWMPVPATIPNPYYVRAEEILWQAFPVVPVYFNTTVALVSPSLKGYPEKNPRNIVYSKDMYITAD